MYGPRPEMRSCNYWTGCPCRPGTGCGRNRPQRIPGGNVRYPNNPLAYDWGAQVDAWPMGYRAYVGREPDQNEADRYRMARQPGETDWNLFWRPIPDPMQVSRPVWFSENPITSGMRAPIADMTMCGGNALCRRGGGY